MCSRMHSEASSANDNTIVLNLTLQKLRFDSRDVLCERLVLPLNMQVFRSRLALSLQKNALTQSLRLKQRKLPRRRVSIDEKQTTSRADSQPLCLELV